MVWQQVLYPYTKSDQIYLCPSSNIGGYGSGAYGANRLAIVYPGTGLSMSAFGSSASTYMFFDSGAYILYPSEVLAPHMSYWYLPGTASIVTPSTPPDTGYTADFTSGRHFQGVNMCFADGHVKWLLSSAVVKEAKNYASGAKNAWDPANPD